MMDPQAFARMWDDAERRSLTALRWRVALLAATWCLTGAFGASVLWMVL